MPIDYWYKSIFRSNHMINFCSGKLSRCLETPHKLVYGVKTDTCSWFLIFSVEYFHHKKYVTITRSSKQPQTLAGIDVGQATNYNVMEFYDLITIIIHTNDE